MPSCSPPGWGSVLLGPDTDKARFPAQDSVELVKVTPSPPPCRPLFNMLLWWGREQP